MLLVRNLLEKQHQIFLTKLSLILIFIPSKALRQIRLLLNFCGFINNILIQFYQYSVSLVVGGGGLLGNGQVGVLFPVEVLCLAEFVLGVGVGVLHEGALGHA